MPHLLKTILVLTTLLNSLSKQKLIQKSIFARTTSLRKIGSQRVGVIFAIACILVLGTNSPLSSQSRKIDATNCTFNGKKLYGKIQYVTSFPDIKIQVVDSFQDLKVQKVSSFPNRCGQWQVVTSFPDTKVQIVNSFPDVKVRFVESFPGL